MAEALKCPDCSAPLSPPIPGEHIVRCQYCNSTILLDPMSASARASVAFTGQAQALGEIIEALRRGSRIDAINVYRRDFSTDLRTAHAAIDAVAAGQPVKLPDPQQQTVTPGSVGSSKNSVRMLAAAILSIGLILAGVLLFVIRSEHSSQLTRTVMTPIPRIPTLSGLPPMHFPTSSPAAPPFAAEVMHFGESGIGAGQFKDARSVTVDGAGTIYVGEYLNGRVQVFDPQGHFQRAWTVDPTSALMNLAATHSGIVLAVTNGKILCFEGSTGRSFGEAATTNGDVQEYYTDAAPALDGTIAAIDLNSNIILLDSNGHIQKTINAHEKTGEDIHFDKIAINGFGEFFALDAHKGVFHFAVDGRFINRFGADESKDDNPMLAMVTNVDSGVLTFPHNLAVDGKGRIFVCDNGPAVRVFSSGGRYIAGFGGREVAFGIAVDDHNDLFVSFRNQNVIRKFHLPN